MSAVVEEIPIRKILVIDDELARGDQGEVFSRKYPLEGFEYVFASEEGDALRRLYKGEEFALILLDMRFEGSGQHHGLTILERLQRELAEGAPPIVMLSSLQDGETILGAWKMGAAKYLVKWSENPDFYEELAEVATHLPRDAARIKNLEQAGVASRTAALLRRFSALRLDGFIDAARQFKEEVGAEWRHTIPFPKDFENYVRGWNESETVLDEAERDGKLLYINMDLGYSCTLRCPHCFTMQGEIDKRGRDAIPYSLLKERILEAKELGLVAVRILGRGEPTQFIAKNEATGERGDIIDFLRFLHANDVTPVVFTRGQIMGDQKMMDRFYGGMHGITTGQDLARELERLGVSVFLGVSSLFPEINDEMVGRGGPQKRSYDPTCREAVRLCLDAGFNRHNPTRFAVESPITTVNIREMPLRYLFFQLLNISPCMNVYMVTGRMQWLQLEKISDPSQDDFLDMYCTVTYFMRRMGIKGKIGPYAGTKECHDVSNGIYITLNGDSYPCPGFEGVNSMVGSIRDNTVKEIWENDPIGRRRQSICPPKIASHFPPSFERHVEELVRKNASQYEEMFLEICEGLGVDAGRSVV